MKIKPISSYISLLLLLIVALSSCEDRIDFSDYDIPEGCADMTVDVNFPDLASMSLGGSRSSGTAIETINNLFVAIYNPSGELMKSIYLTPDFYNDKLTTKPEWTQVSDRPGDGIQKPEGESDMDWAYEDRTTPRVNFKIIDMPFGRYRIYAAANVGDLANSDNEDIKIAVKTEDGLKSIKYTWIPSNAEGTIASNNQMFGYFTNDKNTSVSNANGDYDAKTILFTPTNTSVYAWIRRLASKVTIAYDPSGLKENVTIYIHSVTIHDIPQECYLGKQNPQWLDNMPEGVHPLALFNRKEKDLQNDTYGGQRGIVANSSFNYNRKGITTGTVDTTNPLRGIKLQKGYVGEAAVKAGSVIQGSNHEYNAEALYFYENMQGDYNGIPKFNKEQQERGKDDGVGTNIPEGTYDNEGNPINDYKDKVPYGTYIEVDAYYDASANIENPSKGPIKYRFMLGKNTTYNYDAQRNHHFKLTLGFNGWANQPDWHIEYEEPDPGVFVPDTWYISYLYNQKSMLPIKLTGECTNLEVEITENNWCPYLESTYVDPETWNRQQNASTITPTWPTNTPTTTGLNNYDFVWAQQTMSSGGAGRPALDGRSHPELGFLALLVEGNTIRDIKTSIFETNDEHVFNEGLPAVNAVKTIYDTQKKRTFTAADIALGQDENGRLLGKTYSTGPSVPMGKNNSYQVNPVEDTKGVQDPNQRVVLIPLWTRNKDIIQGSGFSGNNPFEAYPRVANVRITATFNDKGVSITLPPVNCRVIQVKRVTNPKGVWRKAATKDQFHVQLKELAGTNSHSGYKPLENIGTWKAYIEVPTGVKFISLEKGDNPFATKVKGKEGATDTIIGETGSPVDFVIDFKGVGDDETKCAVINVMYNGEMSFHKILVRQGYETPIVMGGSTWSSFSVYGCTYTGGTSGSTDRYNVIMTTNPLALGSLFRRERQSRGIMVDNNTETNFGPMSRPGSTNAFTVLYEGTPTKTVGTVAQTWANIGSATEAQGKNASRTLGTFYDNERELVYRVPSLIDFKRLDESCDYAFGILYGDGAKETHEEWDLATGFQDGDNNDDAVESNYGARGAIAYNYNNGDQIFFPLGKNGMGRRRQFNFTDGNVPNSTPANWYGSLWYADVNAELDLNYSPTTGKYRGIFTNWFRPIAYNLKINAGAIYWINSWVNTDGLTNQGFTNYPNEPCLGWDINYMNLDFKNFSQNNWADACPMKLIITGTGTNPDNR